MDLAVKTETRLDDALDALARAGGPLTITRGGRPVAHLFTPEELERMEDEHDAAVLRAAMAEDKGEPGITLENLAAELNIDLGR